MRRTARESFKCGLAACVSLNQSQREIMDNRCIGVIGLGLMGTAFTERLLAAGYTVWVHNRTPGKAEPLVAHASLGRQSSQGLRPCADQPLHHGHGRGGPCPTGRRPAPRAILIDTTTGAPEQTARLGDRLAAGGVQYLDAPVSGSSEQTRAVKRLRSWADRGRPSRRARMFLSAALSRRSMSARVAVAHA